MVFRYPEIAGGYTAVHAVFFQTDSGIGFWGAGVIGGQVKIKLALAVGLDVV